MTIGGQFWKPRHVRDYVGRMFGNSLRVQRSNLERKRGDNSALHLCRVGRARAVFLLFANARDPFPLLHKGGRAWRLSRAAAELTTNEREAPWPPDVAFLAVRVLTACAPLPPRPPAPALAVEKTRLRLAP